MGQGQETAKQFLRDNPDAAAEIREKFLPLVVSCPSRKRKLKQRPRRKTPRLWRFDRLRSSVRISPRLGRPAGFCPSITPLDV